MQNLTLVFESSPKQEDLEFIGGNLSRFNKARVGYDDFAPLIILLRDEQRNIVGGFIGATYWDWLYVDVLWVQERFRQQGHGSALLTAAEQEAKQRGCQHIFLDTFSFQAPQFYQKRGYVVFGKLPNFPSGHSRYFLQKPL